MKVSVVVPTYSPERYEDFGECVDALLSQTYDDVEIVVIVDGNETVHQRAREDYGNNDDVVIYGSHDDAGPLSRGNMGVIQSSGELVALTDDDAVPAQDWVAELVDAYERHNAIAVGGRIEPEWVAGEAAYIPEEFYFLIGAHIGDSPTRNGRFGTLSALISPSSATYSSNSAGSNKAASIRARCRVARRSSVPVCVERTARV